jgi:hypothetical protein
MALTDQDIKKLTTAMIFALEENKLVGQDDIKSMIESAISDACPFQADEKTHIPHGLGVLKDLGKGDPAEGLRVFRDNQFWAAHKRELERRVSTSIVATIIVILVSAGATALWIGIKVLSQVFNGE